MREEANELSVFLPVRNAVATVGAALTSCLEQEVTAGEVVVVDDGSDDGSAEVVESIAKQNPRVRLIRRGGGGDIVGASQIGLEEGRGKWIARMDADDVSEPQRFRKQLEGLEKNPDWVGCGCAVESPGAGEGMGRFVEWNNGLVTPNQIAGARFIELPVVNPTMMFRRDAVIAAGGYRDPGWAEDYDVWMRVMARGGEIGKVPEVLYRWSDLPGRLTRTDTRYSLSQNSRAKAHFLQRLESVRSRGIAMCGAGRTGKRLARDLDELGVKVAAFVEVHPRKIGTEINGIPVLGDHEVARLRSTEFGNPVVLSAVGIPGARELIRQVLLSEGYQEGDDFYCVA